MLQKLLDAALREFTEVKRVPATLAVVFGLGCFVSWWAINLLHEERFRSMETRIQQLQEAPKADFGTSSLFTSWLPAVDTCGATINSKLLGQFAREYTVALFCGMSIPGRDRLLDPAITISPPHTIDPALVDLAVRMPVSEGMKSELAALIPQISRPSDAPAGLALTLSATLWYEVVLIPKGLEMSRIKTLLDAEALGAKRFPNQVVGTTISMPYNR